MKANCNKATPELFQQLKCRLYLVPAEVLEDVLHEEDELLADVLDGGGPEREQHEPQVGGGLQGLGRRGRDKADGRRHQSLLVHQVLHLVNTNKACLLVLYFLSFCLYVKWDEARLFGICTRQKTFQI